jgi:predicted nucleic acid-binding protein
LLDTNALVALLQGHKELAALLSQAQWLGVSVINVLEFLSFDGLSIADRALFSELITRLTVVDLNYGNTELMERVTELRKTRAVKLPDAIVIASAVLNKAVVLTNDTVLLKLDATELGYLAHAF